MIDTRFLYRIKNTHRPNYISEETKDLEQIVGLQTDKPLKRAFIQDSIKKAEELVVRQCPKVMNLPFKD